MMRILFRVNFTKHKSKETFCLLSNNPKIQTQGRVNISRDKNGILVIDRASLLKFLSNLNALTCKASLYFFKAAKMSNLICQKAHVSELSDCERILILFSFCPRLSNLAKRAKFLVAILLSI